MVVESLDVCMLFQGASPHPAHRVFGDGVGASYRHFETGRAPNGENQNVDHELARLRTGLTRLDDYDVVFAEGSAPLQTLLVYKFRNPSTKSIYLAADETFLTLEGRKTQNLWRFLRPVARRKLDSIVAVGRDAYRWSRPYLGEQPHAIVRPPIQDEKYRLLADLPVRSPQDEFVVVSTGEARESNNYEALVDACERLIRKDDLSVTLVLLGRGHPEAEYAERDHVITPGFVKLSEFTEWLETASVYVQPSIGDAFPVATLEGMLSGTPALVTERVGVRELLPEDQCVEPSVRGLAVGLRRLHEKGRDERERRAADQRPLVESFTEADQQREFRKATSTLL